MERIEQPEFVLDVYIGAEPVECSCGDKLTRGDFMCLQGVGTVQEILVSFVLCVSCAQRALRARFDAFAAQEAPRVG